MEVQARESGLVKNKHTETAPAGRKMETRNREEFREGNYDWKHGTDTMDSEMGA